MAVWSMSNSDGGGRGELMQWAESLRESDRFVYDTLIIAGDASHDLTLLSRTLRSLTCSFNKVFFTYGNHELWTRGRAQRSDAALVSNEKLQHVQDLCDNLGVLTRPAKLGQQLWILPVQSWHHRSFDTEPDIPGTPAASALTISDYRACSWPESITGGEGHGSKRLAEHMDALNNRHWPSSSELAGCDIISFSHFLPRQELLPEKRFLYYPGLAKAAGSQPLGDRITTLAPDIHIFGHSHFSWDARLDGVRYIQAPLGVPRERLRRLPSIAFSPGHRLLNDDSAALQAAWLPVRVYQSGGLVAPEPGMQRLKHGWMCAPLNAHWSNYYATNARKPDNLEVAAWVTARRAKRNR